MRIVDQIRARQKAQLISQLDLKPTQEQTFVEKRIERITLSDGTTGYYVKEYTKNKLTVYIVYPGDADYACVEEQYKVGQAWVK